jgi:1-acyl-sn-glycerol-3-phosphate acyltransferase
MFPPDLPQVKNWFLYAHRVFAKWLSFFYFGISSLLLGILVLPVMRLVLHPHKRFIMYSRRFVSACMRFFFNLMHFLKCVDVDIEKANRDFLKQLSSKIVVASHPSILDSVLLISLLPNADTIVAGHLNRNIILRQIARWLYILNTDDYEKILETCDKSLKLGNCLLIFPEGTRTRRYKKPRIKKGAARISMACGCGIVPVHIGGTDKFGLGKKDSWFGFNPTERYVYRLTIGEEISPVKYKNVSKSAAVRRITKDIEAVLFPEK